VRLASLVLLVGGLALPAQATEWLYCNDALNEVGAEMLLGQADRLYIDSFVLRHHDTVWASDVAVGPGEPTSLGQSFSEGNRFDADFVDGSGALLAELRLHYASEGELSTYGGTLRIVGKGAWAVSCPGS
jgi:hypothetical protein